MTLSPAGDHLYLACEGNGRILKLDPDTLAVQAEVRLDGQPRGLALDPAGDILAVTRFRDDRVVLLNTLTLEVLGEGTVGRNPMGVAWDREGNTLFVANSGSHDLSVVDAGTLTERRRLSMGRRPWAVARHPQSDRLLVSHQLAGVTLADELPHGELSVIDTRRQIVTHRLAVPSVHLAHGIDFTPDGDYALVSCTQVRNRVPITQVARSWVANAALMVVRLTGTPSVTVVPLDSITRCHADVADVAVDPTGQHAFVAAGGGDHVVQLDLPALLQLVENPPDPEDGTPLADNLGVAARFVTGEWPTGSQPYALACTADGDVLVAERLGDALVRWDPTGAQERHRWDLPRPATETPEHHGERVFCSANATFQQQFSCQSCHPDQSSDGLSYDFEIDGLGRNVLKNRDLRGLSGTHPFKWNGKNKTLKAQCGVRFAMVLTRTEAFSPEDLDALVGFLHSLPPPTPRHADPSLADVVARGRELFDRTTMNDGTPIPLRDQCTTCHMPPFFTHHFKMDVGTGTPADSAPRIDPPHLLGVIENAPYLHDGKCRTLEELWTVFNNDDLHGISRDWTKQQLNELVEYLKTL